MKKIFFKGHFGFLTLAAPALLFCHAAGAVSVSPVIVELSPAKQIVSVMVKNTSGKAVVYQVQTLTWQQVEGKDQFQETQDLLVTPPIAEIPAGAGQTFRVTLRAAFSGDTERAYRLILEDVSEAAPAASGTVELRIDQNLPVYVALSGEARLAPAWSLCAADAGKGCVRLDNGGNLHLQVIGLTVAGENWEQKVQGVGAILPGAWKQWLFDLPKGKGLPKKVNAKTDEGSLSADLAPPKR